nr:kelch-like protein 34 [Paramormyrops kingsleyae]
MSYFLVMSEQHSGRVLSQYQQLRSQELLCDVLLVAADGTPFPAHRSLLACSSDYFWSMFKEHTQESQARRVVLPALSSRGLQIVLEFMYTSWLSLAPSTLEDTLEVASYLQVTHAVELCSQYMSDSLSLDTCCFFANMAARYGVPGALTAANSFIGTHMGELLGPVGDRVGLLELNLDSLQEALAVPEMPGVDELPLLLLVLDWLDSNHVSAVKSDLLLSRIRFGLVPPEVLSWLSSGRAPLRSPFVRSLVLKALRYHAQGPWQPLLQSPQTMLRASTTQVLLVGGSSQGGQPEGQVLAFFPCHRKLQHLTDLPCTVRHHCACTVGNFLFVLGGELMRADGVDDSLASNQVWRYDPRFRRWEMVPPMGERRAQFSCCVVNGVIYAIGGRRENGVPLDSVEAYDMRVGCWRQVAVLPCGMYGQACVAYQHNIYISGGIHSERHQSSKDMHRLDLCGPQWKKCAAMSIARSGHQMAALGTKLYVFLGMYELFSDIECFDPDHNEWSRLRPMPSDRFSYGLAPLEGAALLVGGRKWRDGQEVATANIIEYIPESDSWREVSRLPRPLSGTQCTLMLLPNPHHM